MWKPRSLGLGSKMPVSLRAIRNGKLNIICNHVLRVLVIYLKRLENHISFFEIGDDNGWLSSENTM
jgi:hypothetical protein